SWRGPPAPPPGPPPGGGATKNPPGGPPGGISSSRPRRGAGARSGSPLPTGAPRKKLPPRGGGIRRHRGGRDRSEATSARMTRARRSGCWVLALCALVALGGACKKKGPSPNENVGEQGIGEENLGGGSGSLDRARQGLAPGEGGPLQDVHFDYDSGDLDRTARGTPHPSRPCPPPPPPP